MEDKDWAPGYGVVGLAGVTGIVAGIVIAIALIGFVLAGIGALVFRGVQFG